MVYIPVLCIPIDIFAFGVEVEQMTKSPWRPIISGGLSGVAGASLVGGPQAARRVFFSFHYQRDIWRVNQVRNHWVAKDDRQAAGSPVGPLPAGPGVRPILLRPPIAVGRRLGC